MSETAEKRVPFYRNPWVLAFLIGIATIHLIRPMLRHEPEPPPVLSQLNSFALVDQSGAAFSDEELEGRVWVVNFIFTRCGSICPLLTRAMARLQTRYDEEKISSIGLISVTVDPEFDNLEVLAAYAEQAGADPTRWHFLTGEPEPVRRFIVDGFKTPMGPESDEAGVMDIAHSGKLVIVDGSGGIRGYYDSDESGLDEVFHRSQHVLKQQRRGD